MKVNNKTIVSEFFNSWDRTYYLAQYVPYELPPTQYLCGKIGNFALSMNKDDNATLKLQQITSTILLGKTEKQCAYH